MSEQIYSEAVIKAYTKYLEENIPNGIPENIKKNLIADSLKHGRGIDIFMAKLQSNPEFAKYYGYE